MGKASRLRRRKAHRAYEARMAAHAAERAIQTAERHAPVVCPLTDISRLVVTVRDVEDAARFEPEPLTWLVGRVEPLTERKAVSGLRERRLAAYLPIERGYRWMRGQKREIERPLFPGYIFIGLGSRQSVYEARSVAGIDGFVERDGKPAVLSAWQILTIAALESQGAFDHTRPRGPLYSAGQTVRLKKGLWADCIGEVVKTDGDEQVVVHLNYRFGKGDIAVSNDEIELEEGAA